MKDEFYMRRCLELAELGLGRVAPNPMVGSVIVKDDLIIGEGFHTAFGGPHAEVNAIHSVANESDLKSATLYVSLEPCSHNGKTPPCSDLILEKGIPRVVIAQSDPNPLVSGRGIKRLRQNGVEVIEGVLEFEAKELNRRFNTFHEEKRPYIILKWAMTDNGFMDRDRTGGETGVFWISSPSTKKLVHRWRSEEAAILVGSRTVANDNPGLDCRLYSGRDPLRVILAGSAPISQKSKILTDGKPTLVFGALKPEKSTSVEWVETNSENTLEKAMDFLYEKGINSVMVEGGAGTLSTFLDRELWDEARVIVSPLRIENGLRAPVLNSMPISTNEYGPDRILTFRRP